MLPRTLHRQSLLFVELTVLPYFLPQDDPFFRCDHQRRKKDIPSFSLRIENENELKNIHTHRQEWFLFC